MKTKILLFVSLVLLAVQGWATPVGAQTTLSHGNNLTTWNRVELSKDLVLQNGYEPLDLDFSTSNSGGFESKAPLLRGAVDVFNGLYTVYSLLQDAYDIYTYFDNQTEWVRVTYPKASEVIVGQYYELYVTIFAKVDFRIRLDYSSYTDAFDFSSCPDMIYSEEITSDDWCKILKIRFHPTEPVEYNADINLEGDDKLDDDETSIRLHFIAVEEPNEQTIYVSPSTEHHFFSQVNSSDFYTFNVRATGLTGPLNVRLSPINWQNSPNPDCTESDMFSIDGGDWVNIPSDKVTQGSNVTVRYKPTSPGCHCAKIIISSINHDDEVSEKEILLIGEASGEASAVSVSDDFLSFVNCASNTNYSQSFSVKVNGVYTPPLKMFLIDEDVPGMFWVDWIDLDPIIFTEDYLGDSQERFFQVHFNPTIYGTYRAKIIIVDGNDVLQKTITLIGTTNKPTITATPSTLTFPNVTVGNPVTQTFTVKGKDLLGPLTLSPPESTGANCNFTIDKTEISLDQALEGTLVTVTCIPTEDGRLSGRVKISGGGVENPEVVSLSGNAIDPPHIGVNYSSLTFDDIAVGEYATKTFKVTGTNLNGSLTLSVTGATDVFSINKTVISNGSVIPCNKKTDFDITNLTDLTNLTVTSDNNMPVLSSGITSHAIEKKKIDLSEFSYVNNGLVTAMITVTYKPLAEGTQTAMVTISGGGAESKIVSLTGHAIKREITLSPAALVFNDVEIGDVVPKQFFVKASNLTGSLTLKLNDETDMYTIYPSSVTASEAECGKYVNVYYNPSTVGSHIASISVYGGGAIEEKTVSLNGFAVPTAITVTPSSVFFNDVVVGDYKIETFKVRGYGYTSNLKLKVTGATNVFSINKDVITPEEAENGQNITVTYRPNASGTQTAKVTISGGGALENKVVDLKGIAIERKITLDQAALTFSKITVGKDTTKTIKVTGTNLNGPLTVKLNDNTGMYSLNNNKASITITADEAANGANVTVNYKPTVAGSHVASISIYGGGVLEDKTVSLIGSAVVREISTSVSTMNFGKVAKGKSQTKKFTVTAANLTGPMTLELTGVNKGMYKITPTSITADQAASGATVSVTYSPTAKGTHSAAININGGDAREPKTVNLTGQCVVPSLSVSNSSLDFGNMDAGTSKSLTFTVTGTDLTEGISLLIASTDSHADFSITPTSLGSNANGATVKVTCTANVAGSISGRVTISSKDAVTKTVDLTGSVKCYITTNHSSLSYSPSSLNSSVKVTCVGANSGLSLTLIGEDASYFRLGTSSISMADACDGKTVSVSCVPKTKTSLSAKIKITGGGADNPKYVTLSYRKGSSGGETQICAVEPDGGNEGENNELNNGGSLEVMSATTDVNELAMYSKIYAESQIIIIESPVEQSAVISDISGRARSVNLQAGRNEIPVNASGIYIVRIREKITKLMLK